MILVPADDPLAHRRLADDPQRRFLRQTRDDAAVAVWRLFEARQTAAEAALSGEQPFSSSTRATS